MDIEEIAALLHIHEQAHQHGDQLKNLKDAVWAKLKEIDALHAPVPPEPEADPETGEPEDHDGQ